LRVSCWASSGFRGQLVREVPGGLAWHENGVTMAPVGVVQCPRCRQATTPKDPAAREWTCPVCSKVFRFLCCEVCPAYGPIGAVLPGGQRVPCAACGQPVRVPRLAGDKRWGTAADMAADIELRGMPFPRAEPTVASLQAVDPDYRRVAPAASAASRDARWAAEKLRCRPVATPPGFTAFATMPSARQRFVASTANRLFAVLDCA